MTDAQGVQFSKITLLLTIMDIIGEEHEKHGKHECPICTAVADKLRKIQVLEQSNLIDQLREEYGLV